MLCATLSQKAKTITKLHAAPYDISATGFYFDTAEQFDYRAARHRNSYGQPVEEYEIQFIDGDAIDAALFEALRVHQGNVAAFLTATDEWNDDQKVKAIIAIGEAGYSLELGRDDPDKIEMDLYEGMTMRQLAEQFVDEGLYGEIPAAIANYLDYDAIARDLSFDYAETVIVGTAYIYRCE